MRIGDSAMHTCCIECELSKGIRHSFECNVKNHDELRFPEDKLNASDLQRIFSLRGITMDLSHYDPNVMSENLSKHYRGRLPLSNKGPWSFSAMAKCLDKATPRRWHLFLESILQNHFPIEIIEKEEGVTATGAQDARQNAIDHWIQEFSKAGDENNPKSEIVAEAVWEMYCALDTGVENPEERNERIHLLLWDVHERMYIFSRGLLEVKSLQTILRES